MCSVEILQQTNKRFTLNLLIQGAAAHTCLTAHHLVKDQLEALRPGIVRLYDRVALGMFLNYFIGDIPLAFGRPGRFWSRVNREDSPFREHRLLVEHGRELWKSSKQYLVSRGWKKRVMPVPGVHYVQAIGFFIGVAHAERGIKAELARLAQQTTSMIWNIETDQLDGQLTTEVAFGNLRVPETKVGKMVQRGAVGYGGVERRDGRFVVVAKAWFWPLLLHELVKGTAELVCLHGLNTLSDEMYEQVIDRADHIEYETWMLQSGPELWRRFLAAMPPDRQLAEVLMGVARLEPMDLEQLMLAVVQDPCQARQELEQL